jgi:hypothetical protein
MLLANMAKDDSLQRVLDLKRAVPKELSSSEWAMDQLMDCFVKGAEGAYNKNADYDYLSYFFADLGKVRQYWLLGVRELTMGTVCQRTRVLDNATRTR